MSRPGPRPSVADEPRLRLRFPRARTVLAAAALVVLPAAVYLPMLLPGQAPSDFDAFTYLYPYHHALAQAWARGVWFPLWNPSIYMGVPLLGNIQAAALYPPSLLFLLIPGPAAMGWSIVLALAVGGTGMFAYGTRNGLGYAGSLTAAAAYELSSHLTAHAAQLNQIGTFGWAPWLMLAFDRAAARPRLRLVPAIALLVALVVLAGHTQQAYLTLCLAALAGLLRLRFALLLRQWRHVGGTVAAWVAGGVGGALLAAAQLIPTFELQRYSYRQGGLTITEANGEPLPLSGILGSLLPHYSGPLAPEFTGICTAAAVLALAGLALAARWRKPPVAFWAIVSALAVWASTGTQGKLYTVLFHVVPGLDLFRVPSRLLLFSTVGAALLAGYGVRAAQQLAQKERHGSRALAAPAIVTLLVAALIASAAVTANAQALPRLLRWLPQHAAPQDLQLAALFAAITLALVVAGRWLPDRRHAATALGLALLVVVATDSALATANYGGRRTVPASLYEAQGAVDSLVAPDTDHRYLSLVTVTNLGDFDRLVDARRPNLGMGDGRLTPDGYDGGLLPLAEFVRFRAGLLPPGTPNPPDLSLLHMTQKVTDPAWLMEAGVSGVLLDRGLDPNPPTCPRCLVPAATRGDVTLWKPAAPTQPSRAWVEAGGRHVPAHVESDDGDRVVVTAAADRAGRLVLADTFYPGWTATVDGAPATIRSAYGMLRAVDVPPGRHRVVFTYAPRSFQVGLVVSVLTLLLGLLGAPLAVLRRRRRRPRSSPAS